VINATGIFSDSIRGLGDPDARPILAHSRGTHIVLDSRFLDGSTAILVPRTEDGRVIFVLPWEGKTLVGTTDVPVEAPELEPAPTEAEITFLLEHAARYLRHSPQRADVLSAFAGLRPLVAGNARSTASLSRDHSVLVSPTGLVSVVGGKWTTYRRMAEDAVDRAAQAADLTERPCTTDQVRLAGADAPPGPWRRLGAVEQDVQEYERPFTGRLHARLPYSCAMVAFVIEREMPVNLDDVLSRRLRALILDARAAVEAATTVAKIMAQIQGHDRDWIRYQVERFRDLSRVYELVRS
jgi:glycerol-3-phosphate dehydrogenase